MDAFLGEIRLMGCNFAPKGWLFCYGQVLPINANQALFSLLGTTYGGNGVNTFQLPDLRSRVIIGVGQAPGLQNYVQGQIAGTESVTLNSTQLPQHVHPFTGTIKVADGAASSTDPTLTQYPAAGTAKQFGTGTSNASMATGTVGGTTSVAGNNQPHENRQPAMAMNYCIATTGYFPSRN